MRALVQSAGMTNKTSRNDPCPCGSGKKYKKCCQEKDQATERAEFMRAAAKVATTEQARKKATRDAFEESQALDRASNAVIDLVHTGKLDAAEQAAQELLVRYPEMPDGHERLGMVYEARGIIRGRPTVTARWSSSSERIRITSIRNTNNFLLSKLDPPTTTEGSTQFAAVTPGKDSSLRGGVFHDNNTHGRNRLMLRIVPLIASLQQHLDELARAPTVYRPPKCPQCGLARLWGHGHYDRKADRGSGVLNPIPVSASSAGVVGGRVLSCPVCLPPRRWYAWSVQAAVLLSLLSGVSLRECADTSGCARSTVRRWWQWLQQRHEQLAFHLRSHWPSGAGQARGNCFGRQPWRKSHCAR